MKKNIAMAVTLICASMIGFTGCGGSSSGSSESSEATATEDSASESDSTTTSSTNSGETVDDVPDGAVILTIDGEEIDKVTYMLYKYTTTQSFINMMAGEAWDAEYEGMTEEEFVNERVMETLQGVVAAKHYAESNGMTTTDEDELDIEMVTENFIASMYPEDVEAIGITKEILLPLMRDSFMYSSVMEVIGTEVVIDEGAKQQYTAEVGDLIAKDYTILDLSQVLVDNAETANDIVAQLNGGADFEDIFYAYDISLLEEGSTQTSEMIINRGQFANAFGIADDLTPGEILGPVDMGDGYFFVFQVNEIDEPTGTDLQEIVDEIYFENAEYEFADQQIITLMNGQSVDIDWSYVNSLPSFMY